MGKFIQGHQKMGGRKAGTPNNCTVELRDVFQGLDLNIPERIVTLLPQLSPDRQTDVLLKLMEFVFPKRKAIEVYDHIPEISEFELTDEQMGEMAKEILFGEEAVNKTIPTPTVSTQSTLLAAVHSSELDETPVDVPPSSTEVNAGIHSD